MSCSYQWDFVLFLNGMRDFSLTFKNSLQISVREVCLLGFKPHKQACTLKDFMELSIQYFGVLLLLKQKGQQLSRFFRTKDFYSIWNEDGRDSLPKIIGNYLISLDIEWEGKETLYVYIRHYMCITLIID
ncbi:hypothetical protein KIL84_012489 [Mauremys mutica]|uniref:Uncharacterized protein n=1 Tax=Mauremys mutica TaxID=74926 RepID=A0A9D3XR37_9SAUR|nr:hypothetical protein KIL84_012489 [Mauremys mutica]